MFEREYGPLLLHDRVDYGLAVLRGLWQEGNADPMPPWQQREQTDDDMLAVLRRIAKPKGP